MRGFRAIRYIFWEMLPSFFLGVGVFIFILLSFQALRLTEFVLVHGVSITTVLLIVSYLTISFLPAILPMSLLFAVLLTYGRLSQDSEIVAMKSVGLNLKHLLVPAIFLGLCVAAVSAQTSFYLAPWGNRQFEVLITRLAAQRSAVSLREGTFSDGFFNLVVYANKVDTKLGILTNVFIYDERNPQIPITIIAKQGHLANSPSETEFGASLQLINGEIHRISEGKHTRIDFNNYDINLSAPLQSEERKKSPPSLTLPEIQDKLSRADTDNEQKKILQIEFHKRWAISVACLLFAGLGVGLGTVTNRRNARSGQMVLCIVLIITYWILYVLSENLARSGQVAPYLALWLANVIFGGATIWSLKRAQ